MRFQVKAVARRFGKCSRREAAAQIVRRGKPTNPRGDGFKVNVRLGYSAGPTRGSCRKEPSNECESPTGSLLTGIKGGQGRQAPSAGGWSGARLYRSGRAFLERNSTASHGQGPITTVILPCGRRDHGTNFLDLGKKRARRLKNTIETVWSWMWNSEGQP